MRRTTVSSVRGNVQVEAELAQVKRWDWADNVLFAGDLFWLMKEFGWMMLVPHLSMPASIMAVFCAGIGAARQLFQCRGIEEVLPGVVNFIWLSANTIWMFADVLLDSPDQQTPWAFTPLHQPSDSGLLGDMFFGPDMSDGNVTDSNSANSSLTNVTEIIAEAIDEAVDSMPFGDAYDAMVTFTKVCCGIGAAVYFLGLLWVNLRWMTTRSDEMRQAVIAVLMNVSLLSWCLKDLFWTLELLWPALVADCTTIVILLASAIIDGEHGVWSIDCGDIAVIVWVISNLLWMLCELAYEGDLKLRWAASALSLSAFVLLSMSYVQVRNRAINIRSRRTTYQESKDEDETSPKDPGSSPEQSVVGKSAC